MILTILVARFDFKECFTSANSLALYASIILPLEYAIRMSMVQQLVKVIIEEDT